jgi:hypothetical protein
MEPFIKNGLLASLSVEEAFEEGEQDIHTRLITGFRTALFYFDCYSPHLLQRRME